jgi:hypothetical protein
VVSPTRIGEHADEAATSILAVRRPPEPPSRRHRAARAAVVLALLAVLGAGGVIAYLTAEVAPVQSTPPAFPAGPNAPSPVVVPIGGDATTRPPAVDARLAGAPDAGAPDQRARPIAAADRTPTRPARRPRHLAPAGRAGRKPAVDEPRKPKDDGRRDPPAKKEKLPYESL